MMIVWVEDVVHNNDQVKYSATLEFPNGTRENIWYEFPMERKKQITDLADPFLIGSIFFAMTQDAAIHIHGKVSSSLLENLEEYQSIWQCWKPNEYKIASITVDHAALPSINNHQNAIIPFSGGVDSCFSVYRHTHGLCGRRNRKIEAALMVHGFDIPITETEKFQKAASRSQEIVGSVGIPLIRVSTNWRDIQRKYKLVWGDCHSTAIIGALSFFQKSFQYGMIATGDVAYKKINWGSNPLSDPFLSSDSFKIIPDGASVSRIEKVALIASWEAANKNIRVCWEGSEFDKNCGICEKCIQTILDFRATGNGLPLCFEKDINNEQILSLHINSKYVLENFQAILDYANANGRGSESWACALDQRIRGYYQKPIQWQINKHLYLLKDSFRK
jgi:hypothetical protein